MCGDDAIEDPAEAGGDDFPWHLGVFDAHNHIGERAASASNIPTMKARCLAIMGTRTQDQPLIASIAETMGASSLDNMSQIDVTTVIPGFGRHPWFSHELFDDTAASLSFDVGLAAKALEMAKMRHYSKILTPPSTDEEFIAELPTPISLSSWINETRTRLRSHPLAMVGEIGLDKPFRLPSKWTPESRGIAATDTTRTPGGRRGRPLSKHSISLDHQKAVLVAHLRLAGELNRPASVHGVQVHGILFDLLVSCWKGHEKEGKLRKGVGEKISSQEAVGFPPFPPRICLHSFSGKAEAVRQYLNPKFPSVMFFSFSRTNNMRDGVGQGKMMDALKMVPGDRLLVETDSHTAGDMMDADLEAVYRTICTSKGWALEEGVERISRNWKHFIFGLSD